LTKQRNIEINYFYGFSYEIAKYWVQKSRSRFSGCGQGIYAITGSKRRN
jgi:hypothetical protein